MEANQALYICYNSRHGHTDSGKKNGKSLTISNIPSEGQPLLISSTKST